MEEIIEHFVIDINSAEQVYNKTFNINELSTKVTGIQLSSDREDLLHGRGTFQLTINGGEIYSEGFEAKMLMSTINIDPNNRLIKKDIEAGNGVVNISFRDNHHTKAIFEPYQVILYIESTYPTV